MNQLREMPSEDSGHVVWKCLDYIYYAFLIIHFIASFIMLISDWNNVCASSVNACLIFIILITFLVFGVEYYKIKNKITSENSAEFPKYKWLNNSWSLLMCIIFIWVFAVAIADATCKSVPIYQLCTAYVLGHIIYVLLYFAAIFIVYKLGVRNREIIQRNANNRPDSNV